MQLNEFGNFEEFKEYIERKYSTYETWAIGGIDGGNCWNEGGHCSVSPEEEPEGALDDILEEICPDISFLKYRKLRNEVLIYSEKTEYEYYGNHTDYKKKTIDLEKLWNFLKAL